jgi:hypothetical protein
VRKVILSFCIHFCAFFSPNIVCEEGGIKAYDVVKSYEVNLSPILVGKCIFDVWKEVFPSVFEYNEENRWKSLAVDFCGRYFFDEICTFTRKTIRKKNQNGILQFLKESPGFSFREFIAIPVFVVSSLFTIHKVSNLFDIDKNYVWLVVDQLLSFSLFLKRTIEQIMDLNDGNLIDSLPKFAGLLVIMLRQINVTLANAIESLFGLLKIKVESSKRDDQQSHKYKLDSSDRSKLIEILIFYAAAKISSLFSSLKKHPWISIGIKLLKLYGEQEFYKLLYIATGNAVGEKGQEEEEEDTLLKALRGYLSGEELCQRYFEITGKVLEIKPEETQKNENSLLKILNEYSTPFYITTCILLAKILIPLFGINKKLGRLLTYAGGVYYLWWDNLFINKEKLEREIVGYNMLDLQNFYSIIRRIIPGLPNIGRFFHEAQGMVLSIAYPHASS